MGRGGRGYIPDSLVLPRDKTDKIALVDVSHRTNSGVSERLPDEREPGYPHGNVRFIIIFLFFYDCFRINSKILVLGGGLMPGF